VENGSGTAELHPGTAVTLPLGTGARIGADRGRGGNPRPAPEPLTITGTPDHHRKNRKRTTP
ncbi:hypothetical protein ACFVOK_31290, partial [Streptomyces sp. NPDC057798]